MKALFRVVGQGDMPMGKNVLRGLLRRIIMMEVELKDIERIETPEDKMRTH